LDGHVKYGSDDGPLLGDSVCTFKFMARVNTGLDFCVAVLG